MSFSEECYDNGVFLSAMDKRVNEGDVRTWAKRSKHYAYTENYPIVALIDAREASYITAIARQILSRASDEHFLHSIAVVAGDFVVEQNMKLTAMMSASKNIAVFKTLEEAITYSKQQAKLIKEIHGKVPNVF